uniref:Anaphase-promoting complex subunit 4 WD40 domain-containing protein n=1 Tax=Alexandrium monilatum TaxID=311494 RepID=A0A7S4VBT6_9DINO|mmetsp:Transcript_77949/g.240644  ORF Transcript_77949/g.240644 Transcript_77949/m.240644 type:complete len:505 (+) Transcript_77949:71-1585(+)
MESSEHDQDMQVADWEGGDDMDEEFRNGDCVELEFDSGDDAPVDSDGDDGICDENPGEEIGVIDESAIYSDEEAQPVVDDSLSSVAHKESVLSVAVNPVDWRSLATGGQDDVAVLWTLEEHAAGLRCVERCRLEGHSDSVVQVAFSHDGAFVATGSYDGSVRVWAAANGALVHSLEGPSKEVEWILWHPKGHAILAGSTDAMAWMWWAPTGKLMQIFAGHAQSVTCGCWGLGGKVICTGSEDRGVIVWNPRAGAPQQHMRQVHGSAVISICSHPEAPIVVTGSEDATVKVLQMETGKELACLTGHLDSVESVGFNAPSPGGLLLLATASMDGKVFVWDGKTFDLRCTLADHFERGGIVRFRWLPAPQACWLCTCATDQTLRLFNALSGACARTFRGHADTVLDLDLALGPTQAGSAQRLYVVSGSDDKSCKVFATTLVAGGEAPRADGGGAAPAADGAAAPAAAAAAGPMTPPPGAALPTAAVAASPQAPGAPTADRSPGALPV